MKLARWGNSLAIRMPAALVEELGLKEADDIELHILGQRQFGVEKKPSLTEMLAAIPGVEGCVPADFKFNRETANER